MFSVGVELRSWVTTPRAPRFERIIDDVRRVYRGLLTYSANWDDVDDTVVLGDVDVIGINAFYPLADENGASDAKLLEGGARVRDKVHALAERWQRAGGLHRDRLHDAPRSGRADPGSGPTR